MAPADQNTPAPGHSILSNLDFSNMIGGPLEAAVEAQTASAFSTLEFISQIGFTGVTAETENLEPQTTKKNTKVHELGNVRYVKFSYELAAEGTSKGAIEVPLLTVVPVPYLSIRTLDIDFRAKIVDIFSDKVSSSRSNANHYSSNRSSGGGLIGWIYGGNSRRSRYTSSYSSQGKKSTESSQEAEYHLSVKVHAENLDMPTGLSRILGILESNMTGKSS